MRAFSHTLLKSFRYSELLGWHMLTKLLKLRLGSSMPTKVGNCERLGGQHEKGQWLSQVITTTCDLVAPKVGDLTSQHSGDFQPICHLSKKESVCFRGR